MRLEKVGRIELIYTAVDEETPYPEGGQVYGILTGTLDAGGLRGAIHATNFARLRPDGVFLPTLRGILTTPEGPRLMFTMDGLSIRDPHAKAPRRLVTTGITLWNADPKFREWNESYLVAELEGGPMKDSWGVFGPLYRCVSEL